MTQPTTENLKLAPPFDLELYLLFTGTRRIDGSLAERLNREWAGLLPGLKTYRLAARRKYLLIYLDPSLEQRLDTLAEQDAQEAETIQTLAQAMIMSAMLEALPEADLNSCAPVPEPRKDLQRALHQLGLELDSSGGLNVRFGVLTRLPYTGGCDSCFIKARCTKHLLGAGTGGEYRLGHP